VWKTPTGRANFLVFEGVDEEPPADAAILWLALDMLERGIARGTLVEIESLADDQQKRVVRGFKALPYNIPNGSIAAYYPETNPLLPLAYHDPKSKTPAAKSIPVVVRPQPARETPAKEPVAAQV
jgi:hypothetical protein